MSFLVACAGDPPPDPIRPDAFVPMPDAQVINNPMETGQRVAGKARDYFVPTSVLANTNVTTDGIMPVKSTTSVADGSYALQLVPVHSVLFLEAGRSGYRTTRNLQTTVKEVAVNQDVFVMSVVDVNRQHTTAGVPVTSGRSFVVAELRSATSQPLVGIAKSDVVLLDSNDQPVAGVAGPHFFGSQGDINPAQATSVSAGGVSRVAFLNVPAGNYKLKVTYPDGTNGTTTDTADITSIADGAVLAFAGGPPVNQGPIDPKFATDVYPRLQTAANGGVGCANCHTAGGSGAILILNDSATAARGRLLAKTGLVVTMSPATSQLLTKPLYEVDVQDHPNATFVDTTDRDYKLIYRWIANGAKP